MQTNSSYLLKGCHRCSGDLRLVPDLDSDGYEAKCIQCGRVGGQVTRLGQFVPLHRARTADTTDLPAEPAKAVGESERVPAPSLKASDSVKRAFDALLSAEEKDRGVSFRVAVKEGQVALNREVARTDDVVFEYHDHPVLSVDRATAGALDHAVIEVAEKGGRRTVVIRQSAAKKGKPRSIRSKRLASIPAA